MEKISFYEEKENNKEEYSQAIKILDSSKPQPKYRKFLAVFAIFLAIFFLINTDYHNLFSKVQSYWSADSVRNFQINQNWVAKYKIILNDKIRISEDADGDKLTFAQEQYYNTNPFQYDTDRDGVSDGEEIKNGTDPLGTGELDNDQDKMPDKWEERYGLAVNTVNASEDPDSDGLLNLDEYLRGTDPNNADTDGDSYNDREEIINGYDPAAPGDAKMKIIILSEKINLVAPVVWSETEEEAALQKDLENGVVRYPKTGVPGQFGNMIIAGHSSNYAWAKGSYNSIFRNLNNLQAGDKVIVRTVQQNGKTFEYEYKVTEKKVVSPDKEWVFENPEGIKRLTLSTCWPIGTNISRLVIRAELS